MIVGGALAMVFAKNVAPQKMLIIGMLGQAIGIGIIGYSTNLWVTLTAQLFSGLALPCIQIGINTLIIQNSDTDFIGRVNGILSPLFYRFNGSNDEYSWLIKRDVFIKYDV